MLYNKVQDMLDTVTMLFSTHIRVWVTHSYQHAIQSEETKANDVYDNNICFTSTTCACRLYDPHKAFIKYKEISCSGWESSHCHGGRVSSTIAELLQRPSAHGWACASSLIIPLQCQNVPQQRPSTGDIYIVRDDIKPVYGNTKQPTKERRIDRGPQNKTSTRPLSTSSHLTPSRRNHPLSTPNPTTPPALFKDDPPIISADAFFVFLFVRSFMHFPRVASISTNDS
jgi:hypothetical protein